MTRSERLEEIRKRLEIEGNRGWLNPAVANLFREDIPWLLSELEKARAEGMEDARRQLRQALVRLAEITKAGVLVKEMVLECARAVGDYPLSPFGEP